MQRKYNIFLYGTLQRSSFRNSTSNAFCRSDVDENNEVTKRRCMKQFVITKIGDSI